MSELIGSLCLFSMSDCCDIQKEREILSDSENPHKSEIGSGSYSKMSNTTENKYISSLLLIFKHTITRHLLIYPNQNVSSTQLITAFFYECCVKSYLMIYQAIINRHINHKYYQRNNVILFSCDKVHIHMYV